MNAVQQTIRILVVILLVHRTHCQDGYSERDLLRFQQMVANQGQLAAIASYNNNIAQKDPNSQAVSSVNVQYHVTDGNDDSEYHRADRTRTRKVYRIKNPFQHQQEDNRQDGTLDPRDSSTGASNQYASMQYSLPPEEFLQQMRAESQFYQQSTPAPNLGYTATPQPQYQYSTISPSSYDTNQQASQIPQLESKSQTQYMTNTYQYNAPNTFSFDGVQSTPSPVTPFISTALPNSQFISTPSNYVSSASSIFLSSPPNPQYVSSPLSVIQTGSPDYNNNRVTTTIGSNGLSYDNNDVNKKLQIDHYDNSANGIRYPNNGQRQYQNEYVSSTISPTVSPDSREQQWQNNLNAANAAAKSLQDVTFTQYQNYPYNQQDNRADANIDHSNSETHRVGNMPSANNIYLNYISPEYPVSNNGRASTRTRDLEQQTGQQDYYSNGEYGWKLEDKKQSTNNDALANYRYHTAGLQLDNNEAVSQMNFHMDTSKQYSNNFDQALKQNSDNIHALEFAKAAARTHDSLKQHQNLFSNNYDTNYNSNNNNPNALPNGNSYYSNYEKQKSKYLELPSQTNYFSQQSDLITASPYYYSRENSIDNKPKPTFDHAKALKNIVPIDVSNVVSNSESQKGIVSDSNNRYSIQNYDRDQLDRQQYRPVTDSFYKDKNAMYGFNIKTKPEEYQGHESQKLFDPNVSYYGKQQQISEPNFNLGTYTGVPQRLSYISQSSSNGQDNIQSSANIQEQGVQRPSQPPTDINSILKLNDVPHQLTQNYSPDAFKFHNINYDRGSIPSPLPMRINQDVGSHQLDVTSNLLSKLMFKQPGYSLSRPDSDPQAGSLVSTINGFKVANPYNMDLKLVADMLKGKSSIDDILSHRDQYSKPTPLKFDLAQLQLLLKNENGGGLAPVSDSLSVLSNPFLEIYNSGRYPYQKYSRSQEEEEPLVPIADASSNHPIGAVMEQDDSTDERESTGLEESALNENSVSVNHDDRPKKPFHSHRSVADRHRHPNSLMPGRHSFQRRYPKSNNNEPYPLLKPPPPNSPRGRVGRQKHMRRRRVNKPKVLRILKTEPLFEADAEDDESYENPVPIVLRPPAPVIEAKSDVNVEDNDGSS